MVITLTGSNSVALRQRLADLVKAFVHVHGELAVERLDGEEISAQVILDAAGNLPFLASKKLLVIRNLSSNKESAETLEQIISSAGDTCDIVFLETAPDKRTVYYKNLKKLTQAEEFNDLDGPALIKWLEESAQDQGGKLNHAEAVYLVERVGANQQLLASELDKLITYEPQVTRENIDLLTAKTPQSKVFDLLDAAFAGNKKRALSLYEEQRMQKVEPQEIMAMLAWQLRLITLTKLGGKRTSTEIAKDAGLNPYPVAKAQNLARNLSPSKLRTIVNQAEKIDRLSKSKPIDLDEALKSYISTI